MAATPTLTPIQAARAATEFALAAANVAGDSFVNTGKEALVINNAAVTPVTLTIITQATVDDCAVADKTVTIGAGKQYLVGPFPKGTYNDADGLVHFTYSGVTTLTVGVARIA